MQGGSRAGSTGFSLKQQLALVNRHTNGYEKRWKLPTFKTYRREAIAAGFIATDHRGRKKRASKARGRRYTVLHLPDCDMGNRSLQAIENTSDNGAFSSLVSFVDYIARKAGFSRTVSQPSRTVSNPSRSVFKLSSPRASLLTLSDNSETKTTKRERPSSNASSKDRRQESSPSHALSRDSRNRVESESNEPSQADPTKSAQAKSKSATNEATTLTGELVAEFNRQAENHGIAKREKETTELTRAVKATGETLEELRRVVVGLFGENADHRDIDQRLWFLKQGYGIRSAIKRLETRDRLRAFAEPFEQEDRIGGGLDEGDRITACAESHAGAHTPGALKEREDGRFACGFGCGFSKSGDVRAYELKQSKRERAFMAGFVRWDASANEVRFEKTGRDRLRKKLGEVALAEGLAPLADAEIQRGWGTLNGHLIGASHKTEANKLPAVVLNWFENELRSGYRRKRSEPAGYQGLRDYAAEYAEEGAISVGELFGLPSGERKPA